MYHPTENQEQGPQLEVLGPLLFDPENNLLKKKKVAASSNTLHGVNSG